MIANCVAILRFNLSSRTSIIINLVYELSFFFVSVFKELFLSTTINNDVFVALLTNWYV